MNKDELIEVELDLAPELLAKLGKIAYKLDVSLARAVELMIEDYFKGLKYAE
jgi:hypothetical protein